MKKSIIVLFVFIWAVLPVLAQEEDPKISFEANNAPISSVLKSIVRQNDLNLVLGSGIIDKRISISLKDVTLEVALGMIAKSGGFAYERIGNTILVDSPEHLETRFTSRTRVYPLNYIGAKDAAASLAGLKNVNINVNNSANALVVSTTPETHMEIVSLISQLDLAPKQILIQARLIEVSLDKTKAAGINWDKLTSQTFIFAEDGAGLSSEPGVIPDDMGYTDLDSIGDFARQMKVFQATIDMIMNKGYGKILSSTKLVAMNNEQATIHIGDIIPYVVKTEEGDNTNYQVEREEIGIKLTIEPRIAEEGSITVHVKPEVSNIYGWKGQNADIPWVKTRTAETKVTVKDGEPIIIAGLQNENETYERKGLWPLSEIPILKIFFSYRKKVVQKTDLIIEITPYIVDDPAGDAEKAHKAMEEILDRAQ
jgi:type IV pilus assembly protein PilQ